MIQVWVELSGESPDLALAELEGACAAVGGEGPSPGRARSSVSRGAEVTVPDRAAGRALAGRLALAYRVVGFQADRPPEPRPDEPATFRWLGHGRGNAKDPETARFATAWTASGGRIDLEAPERRFWIRRTADGTTELGEELGAVDRGALLRRRISRLPFRRPVGLDPRLARVVVNLARVRPGDRVVDPFVGTGALLAEAALLGARVTGVDVDAEMIRGAGRNFAHLGLEAERWIVADAEDGAKSVDPATRFDSLITDVPYGRSSGTRGEEVPRLLRRALPSWAHMVRAEGRVVTVSSEPVDPPGEGWRCERAVSVRQHRSLTRTFAVYRRTGPG